MPHPTEPLDLMPREPIDAIIAPIRRFLHIEATSGVLLVAATLAAIAAANSAAGEAFLAFWQTPAGLRFGAVQLELSLQHWINDFLMAVFFYVIGLEVKRELVKGELRDLRRAALPLAAAVGGMLAPAAVYLFLQHGTPGGRGWGIPMATDIAFVVGCLALLGGRIPVSRSRTRRTPTRRCSARAGRSISGAASGACRSRRARARWRPRRRAAARSSRSSPRWRPPICSCAPSTTSSRSRSARSTPTPSRCGSSSCSSNTARSRSSPWSQARSQYDTAAAAIPQIERDIAQTENAISILLGRNPGPVARGKVLTALSLPGVPAGVPSQLLERRPDIAQAEQQLIAANAQIGAARAQYFPPISLTGAFGSASGQLSNLFSGPARVWSYAGAFAGPIFTGGLIAGQVAQAEAGQQAALVNYQAMIQSAFAHVENALASREKVAQQVEAEARRVKALAE